MSKLLHNCFTIYNINKNKYKNICFLIVITIKIQKIIKADNQYKQKISHKIRLYDRKCSLKAKNCLLT